MIEWIEKRSQKNQTSLTMTKGNPKFLSPLSHSIQIYLDFGEKGNNLPTLSQQKQQMGLHGAMKSFLKQHKN